MWITWNGNGAFRSRMERAEDPWWLSWCCSTPERFSDSQEMTRPLCKNTIYQVSILEDVRRLVLGVFQKEWCWSWNSSTLATSCEELTHWKRFWCWEGLGAGGEGDNRGWDGWMASPTRWTWVWVNSRSWWWTGRPGVQMVGHNWATELNWTDVQCTTRGSEKENLSGILVEEFSPWQVGI